MTRRFRTVVASLLTLAILAAAAAPPAMAEASDGKTAGKTAGKTDILPLSLRETSYNYYRTKNAALPAPAVSVDIPVSAFTEEGAPAATEDYEGRTALRMTENRTVACTVEVPESGRYLLELIYYPDPDRSGNGELAMTVDGAVPFDEAGAIVFGREWMDKTKEFARDNRDNELRPVQVNRPGWLTADCRDKDGLVSDPFYFALEAGTHALSLTLLREPMAVAGLRLHNPDPIPNYDDYSRESFPAVPDTYLKTFQAEHAYLKSDPSLYPITDRTSPMTETVSAAKIRLNTIGGSNWRYPGQWISWEIEVPQDGDYVIGMRYRQDFSRSMNTHRKVTINGELLFEEMAAVPFSYANKWQVGALGGEEPYVFHLKAGTYTIGLEAVTGTAGQTILVAEQCIYNLNELYRKIISITGVIPDIYQDYDLERDIPDMVGEFLEISRLLTGELERIEEEIGQLGPEVAVIREVAAELKRFADKPRTLVEHLDRFKTNIGSLSDAMFSLREQALEIDYLFVASPQAALPKAEANLFSRIWFELKAFFISFFEDYDAIGSVSDAGRSIEVWIGSGRDQAQAVKGIIDDLFTPQTNINVNLSLVQGTLVEATLAGKGPDVALGVARHLPVDFAVRDVLVPLDTFGGMDDIRGDFQETAFEPYTVRGHVYAFPETQDFNMLFYRKDIMAQLGLSPPTTWDEMLDCIRVIEENNMDVGIPSLIQQVPGDTYTPFPRTIGSLLIQNGLDYYNADRSASSFSDPKAIEAFEQYIALYRDYSLPVYYDFANRFRRGEMPLGIASFSTFNMLYIFAPEIRSLWGMAPIPGTPQGDAVNIGEEAYGSACIVFNKIKDPEAGFEFVKWWVSEEAQTRYNRDIESIMGPAARNPTANLKAFNNLSWSADELAQINRQRAAVVEQPEIPGSYSVSRNLNNAIIEILYQNGNVLSTLEKYNKYIDEELQRKREEFNLG